MRIILVISLSLLLSAGCTARQNAASFEECKNAWLSISGDPSAESSASIDEMIVNWGAYENKCKNSGIYEAKLSSLYFIKGDIAKSNKVLENAKSPNKEYEAIINIYKTQNNLQTDINNQMDIVLIRNKYHAIFDNLLNDYSEFCITYESVASFYLVVTDYKESFNAAKKSVQCNTNSWSGYKMMAINSVFLNDFSNTSNYCGKAQSINKNITADPYFMLSCAKGFAYKNDFETSDAILTIINIKTPEAKSMPEYSETLQFIENAKISQSN